MSVHRPKRNKNGKGISNKDGSMLHAAARQRELSPFEDSYSSWSKNKFFRSLMMDFFKATAPVPVAIFNILSNFNDQLNDEQKKTLSEIAQTFVRLPFQMLSGELSLKGAYQNVQKAVHRLSDFVIKNPELMVSFGVILLQSLVPFEKFLNATFKAVAGSELPDAAKAPIKRATKALVRELGNLFLGVKNALKSKPQESAKKPRPPHPALSP